MARNQEIFPLLLSLITAFPHSGHVGILRSRSTDRHKPAARAPSGRAVDRRGCGRGGQQSLRTFHPSPPSPSKHPSAGQRADMRIAGLGLSGSTEVRSTIPGGAYAYLVPLPRARLHPGASSEHRGGTLPLPLRHQTAKDRCLNTVARHMAGDSATLMLPASSRSTRTHGPGGAAERR